MIRDKRAALELVRSLHLTVLDVATSGGTHVKTLLRTPKGHQFITTFASTSSDWRANRNMKAWLKRRIRELDGQP